jgi:hypothetical protein
MWQKCFFAGRVVVTFMMLATVLAVLSLLPVKSSGIKGKTMSKEITKLEAKIQQLENRLRVVESEQAVVAIKQRLAEVESTLAAFEKFNRGEN